MQQSIENEWRPDRWLRSPEPWRAGGTFAAEVGAAVARWRDEAAGFGVTKSQFDRMACAFEHADLALARKR